MKANRRFNLLTPDEVTEWFGIPKSRLETLRYRPAKNQTPLPFIKIGREIRYREDHLVRWLESNTFDTADQAEYLRR